MQPSVIRLLRELLLLELSNAANLPGRLAAPGRLEKSRSYRDVSRRIDAARNLLDQVGTVVPKAEGPIGLELNDYRLSAYKIVETSQALTRQAAEDAEHEGRPQARTDAGLEQFVRAFRRELDANNEREAASFDG